MNRLFSRQRKRDESGVVAILVGVLALLIMMFAAYAVDIGMQVNRKHQLEATLDAAAEAGAFDLPGSSVTAKADALAFAVSHDETATGTLAPNVDFWCVVASKASGASYIVDDTQIPATCYPGTSPYTVGSNYKATGQKVACSAVLCAIPCVEPAPNTGTPKIACNTIRVFQGRDVPFAFAPAGGILKGSTGNIISVACKGSCGTIAPNPLDVAVVADRTGSMADADVADMVAGIKGMLTQMTPSQQYVALGTIGRASTGTTPSSEPGASCPSSASSNQTSGTWIPVPFSNNYLSGTGTNSGSALVKSLDCLGHSSTGTALAAPMKAAARYLLGKASNNLSSLPTRSDPANKVLIFETDGQPNESPASNGTASLDDSTDLFSNTGDYTTSGPVSTGPVTTAPTTPYPTKPRTVGTTTYNDIYKTTYLTTTKTTTKTLDGGQGACSNLNDVATNAKAAGILVITIAYNLGGNHCGESNPALPSSTSDTSDATPVVTSITPGGPSGADKNGDKVVDPTYAGTATVNQTVARTITKVNWNTAFDALVTNTLAGAASNAPSGVASDADNTCVTTAEQVAENSDGDYFFCAASGTDMAPIFRTALSQASKGIKLIKMPGS